MAIELAKVRRAVPFKVDRDRVDDSPGGGIGFTMLQWLVGNNNDVPPHWSRARDAFLRKLVYDNDALKTAVLTFTNKVVTIPFSIEAHDRSIARHVRSAANLESSLRRYSGSMSSSPIKGFEEAFKMFVKDYVTQDNGAFMQVLGEGPSDGPIVGAPTGVVHLDSALCTRTKDIQFPVKYLNAGMGSDNKEYKLHYTRVIEMANLPSSEYTLNGVGLCAVSCCIDAARELWDMYKYSQEMFGSRPPNQILYAKKGATKKNLDDMLLAWQMKMDQEQRHRFGGTLVVAPRMANQELELAIIKLSQMPENYIRKDATTINKSEIAAAFGLDLRDLAYTLGAPSRTGDAEVQDRKGRGKGVGEFIETFTKRMNEVYLNSDTHFINFDYLDDEQDEQQSVIRNARAQARERDLRSGITTIRVERELMLKSGEISRAEFEQMELQDGRLPEGLDVLLLFQSQDSEYKEWLDVGAADPTNVSKNEPTKILNDIHDQYIAVSQYIHEETNPLRRQKALQALAALDKLRTMYEEEGQKQDEQAALEEQNAAVAAGAQAKIAAKPAGSQAATARPATAAKPTALPVTKPVTPVPA